MWKSLPATSPQGIYNKSEEAKPNPMDELTDDELVVREKPLNTIVSAIFPVR